MLAYTTSTTLPTKNFDSQSAAACRPEGHCNSNRFCKWLLNTFVEHTPQQNQCSANSIKFDFRERCAYFLGATFKDYKGLQLKPDPQARLNTSGGHSAQQNQFSANSIKFDFGTCISHLPGATYRQIKNPNPIQGSRKHVEASCSAEQSLGFQLSYVMSILSACRRQAATAPAFACHGQVLFLRSTSMDARMVAPPVAFSICSPLLGRQPPPPPN